MQRMIELPGSLHPFFYKRFPTREVRVGRVTIGGPQPIRIQSMVSAPTMDTEAVVRECLSLDRVGCEIVRVTARDLKEAENLGRIRERLHEEGSTVPLVADIHFSPRAAMIAVEHVEKVRINPGNFVDRKKFETRLYSDSEYTEELERIEESFLPLLRRAMERERALRIGVNHGSLSDRIMSRYGDTTDGMVESAMEFLRIARKHDFHSLVVSMKSSNPKVMVEAYRLLVRRFQEESMDYPLHLGVTEAGDGRDGRIRSAIGIGTLLEDGIGDTIRVSLTEDSVLEIPVARAIASRFDHRMADPLPYDVNALEKALFSHPSASSMKTRNETPTVRSLFPDRGNAKAGGESPVLLAMELNISGEAASAIGEEERELEREREAVDLVLQGADWLLLRNGSVRMGGVRSGSLQSRSAEREVLDRFRAGLARFPHRRIRTILGARSRDCALFVEIPPAAGTDDIHALLEAAPFADGLLVSLTAGREPGELFKNVADAGFLGPLLVALRIPASSPSDGTILDARLVRDLDAILEIMPYSTAILLEPVEPSNHEGRANGNAIPSPSSPTPGVTRLYRLLLERLRQKEARPPVIIAVSATNQEELLYEASIHAGGLFLEDRAEGLLLRTESPSPAEERLCLGLDLLQAVRLRINRADFISCPSCGRTQFDLQKTTQEIKGRLAHLKGVKIGIMGCIVNGPGEMADADFGYVGAGPDRVDLYRRHHAVKRNIPAATAVEELVDLIKSEGLWVDPPGTTGITGS